MKVKGIFAGLTIILFVGIVQVISNSDESSSKEIGKEGESSSGETKGSSEEKNKLKPSSSEEKAKSKSNAQTKTEGGFKLKKCQGYAIEIPNQFVTAHKTCEEELKAEANAAHAKDSSAIFVCGAVCLWEKMDFLLGAHKKLDSSAVDDFIDALLNGPLQNGRPVLKVDLKECKKQIGDEDEDDKKCKRFKNYFGCVVAAFDKLCATPINAQPKKQAPTVSLLSLNLGR